MKRVISLLLAILMVTGLFAAFGVSAAAEGGASASAASSKYVVYEEDFEMGANASKWSTDQVLEALGWYIPDAKADRNIAEYLIVDDGNGGQALRISTNSNDIQGVPDRYMSFVTMFNGDLMSVVRNGNFTISYDLTYRAGTKNTNGYTAMIYNYNEKDNENAKEGEEGREAYGIVAIRACGTGLNNIYSPLSDGNGFVECAPNEGDISMSNRYQLPGEYQSLYSRIAASLGDTDYVEDENTTLQGKDLLIEKTIKVVMNYDFEKGMSVRINDVLVSTPNTDIYANAANYSGLWSTFLERSTGAALGLVTTPYVVADIDNIKVQAEQIGGAFKNEMPELVISEVCARPRLNYGWADFLEIYNPGDYPVDLADYVVMTSNYTETTVDDMKNVNMMMHTFFDIRYLEDHFGTVAVSNAAYVAEADLIKMYDFKNLDPAGNTRFKFVNEKTYKVNDNGSYTEDPKGQFRYIQYLECWNTIYDPNSENAANFHMDTYLQPGQCAVIMAANKGWGNTSYAYGVNAGTLSETITIHSMNCRNLYRRMGLSKDVKIIFSDVNPLTENVRGQNIGGRRYYLAKAYDENGNRINYTSKYIYDKNVNPYIVCYADYSAPLVEGYLDENAANNPDHGYFGLGGVTHGNRSWGVSGSYIYGVDASRDPRCGTMYSNRNSVTNGATAHVGCLSGAQEIVMKDMYTKAKADGGTLADLTITEIAPNTNNLAGEAKKAFTAMELTNTSSKRVNLYDYSLVSSEVDDTCTPGMGFSYFTKIQAGNPVEKTSGNGSYYYFAQDHISNPTTCVLEPGETVVIWFLTEDTYSSYSRDDTFGFDYFRQYWANQGNTQLAVKSADGGYATKVVAVDANVSKTLNVGNTDHLFELTTKKSVVYGVAQTTEDLEAGNIYSRDVESVAILGAAFIYFKLEYGPAVSPTTGETWYALIFKRDIPVNTSMRYVAGGAGNSKCGALGNSIRSIRYYQIMKYTQMSQTPLPLEKWAYRFDSTNAPMEPRLGTLDGKEVLPLLDQLFVKTTSETGDETYHYFDAVRTNIMTLQGAAVNTAGSKPKLRFDNAISKDVYSSLVSTYGNAVEIGTLIVKTDALGDVKTFTEDYLSNAGISYKKEKSSLLYRGSEYAILSSSIEVDSVDDSYTAIGYMKITLSDGTVKTIYSSESISRNVKEVASAALYDLSEQRAGIYQYNSINSEGTVAQYSPYSADVQRKLSGYIGL